MDSLPVRFDTSSIADDPEFERLVTELSLAKMALTSYLNRTLELKLIPGNGWSDEKGAGNGHAG